MLYVHLFDNLAAEERKINLSLLKCLVNIISTTPPDNNLKCAYIAHTNTCLV